MKTLIEMKAERSELDETATAILASAEDAERSLTPEEQARFDVCTAKIQALNEQIKRREDYEELRKPLTEPPRRESDAAADPLAASFAAMSKEDRPFTVTRNTEAGLRVEVPRPYGRLTAYADTPRGHEEAYRSGMWLAANIYGNNKAKEWCRINGVRAGMSEGVNTAGGNLVPTEMEASIIKLMNT